MDIFHTGKEDVSDDHKFINERLLELAIPDEPPDGHVITLEECLEMFFNNKIEVKRYLDQLERRNTLNSIRSRGSIDSTKGQASHVEVAEVGDGSQPSSPVTNGPQPVNTPMFPPRPTAQRKRAPSIIQEHYIDEKKGLHESPSIDEAVSPSRRVRKEVMMPAWQFFSLIPWYTNNVPSNDAQVAAHFSSTRPVLGICLKRYSILPNGTAVKRKTRIDIPLEIALPHFIQDDKMAENGPAFGNFKLSLQSAVCHQGESTESGHYISLARCPERDERGESRWMRFDDLASERVTSTHVENFLAQESPYLLFYQVIPIEGDPDTANNHPMNDGEQPPAYSESDASRYSQIDSRHSDLSLNARTSYTSNGDVRSDPQRPSVEIRRPSFDASASEDGIRGRSSNSTADRPKSLSFDIGTSVSKTDLLNAPVFDSTLPSSDGPNSLTASRRGSKDEKRMSTSLSRLASRMSKDRLNKTSGTTASTDTNSSRRSLDLPTQASSSQSKDSPSSSSAQLMNERANLVIERWQDRGRARKEAKEKNRMGLVQRENAQGQGTEKEKGKGRRREGKPERECAVM